MSIVVSKKLSIAVSEDVAAALRRVAARERQTASAWLNDVTERALLMAEGRTALLEHFARFGEPNEEARSWAAEIVRALETAESV